MNPATTNLLTWDVRFAPNRCVDTYPMGPGTWQATMDSFLPLCFPAFGSQMMVLLLWGERDREEGAPFALSPFMP